MQSVKNFLAEADVALSEATASSRAERLTAMTRFMQTFEELARRGLLEERHRPALSRWAEATAPLLLAAEQALSDWEVEMGRIFYRGGEEDTRNALNRRSQHALARAVFLGTPIDEVLAAYETEDVDDDMHREAVRLRVAPPPYYPRTHRWWRWPGDA